MTQKRILRANAPKVVRERELLLRDAFRASWADLDDPAVAEKVAQLAKDDADETATQLFTMVGLLIEEVVDATGDSREAILARLQR